MRIVHITRDFPPRMLGGLSTAVGGLVSELARQGCEILVLSFDNYRPNKGPSGKGGLLCEEAEPGVSVVRIDNSEQLPEAKAIALEYRPEIVHLHHEVLWDFSHEIASPFAAPIVYSVHVLQTEQNRLREIDGTMSSQAQHRALLWSTVIHAPSQIVSDILTRDDPSTADKIQVIRLGSEFPEFEESEHETGRDTAPLLLYAGRFADINGFAELLHALPELFEAHPSLRAIIAGGLPGNRRAQARWQKQWQEIAGDLHGRLDFVGWQSPDDLSKLYLRAHMLVVPSWFETFGQVALEGMLHGTPLIVSDAGALPELADSDCATVIPAQDSAAIVAAVHELLANPEATGAKGKVAMQRAQAEYRWHERAAEFVRMYRGLV
ncbi:MAG: glycosyltransferase family 4 protein [Kofleriaceae bacterium]|nr:glycosyltransferase family 4 protein [Kofleriaceae bacterium]